METSLKLQMDVKNNAEELRRYMLDLKNWEDEMKKKESELKNKEVTVTEVPPPRNKRNITEKLTNIKTNEQKPKKIQAYDYSAWDKYDADKACEEIDEESVESDQVLYAEEETLQEAKVNEEPVMKEDNVPLKHIDEAFYEKELGNQFVKKGKWEDAIRCYTRSIELDPHNAIYYANRALCYIKLKNFKAAEVDSTAAIQLDKTYIKALQRRATARTALGQFKESLADYQEILKLEPNNAFANFEVSKLEKKVKAPEFISEKTTSSPVFNPKSIFKNETTKDSSQKVTCDGTKKLTKAGFSESKAVTEQITVSGDAKKSNKTSDRQTTDFSRNTEINESVISNKKNCSGTDLSQDEVYKNVFGECPADMEVVRSVRIPPHLRSKKPLRRITMKDIHSDSETFEEFNAMVENISATEKRKKLQDSKINKSVVIEEPVNLVNANFPIPQSCVQFQQAWKLLNTNPSFAYSYLKKIKPGNLEKIFRHSLESDLFSQLISVLSHDDVLKDYDFVCSFLHDLSCVQRFGSLILFMSSSDKENLNKCLSALESNLSSHVKEIAKLREVYELPQK